MRESGGGGENQLNPRKVSLLHWKDMVTCGAVVWCGKKKKKKSFGVGLRRRGFATPRQWDCLSAVLNHIYQNKERRADSENTLESEGSGLPPDSIHCFVIQLCLNYLHIGHCSVPVCGLGMVIPSVPLRCSRWRSVRKALNLFSAKSTDSVVCSHCQTWQADF